MMILSLDELEKRFWQYKSLYNSDNKDEEALSRFAEDTLNQCGITIKENLGRDFMLCLRHFTDVQYGNMRPHTAAMKIVSYISTKTRLETCLSNIKKKEGIKPKKRHVAPPNKLWVDEEEIEDKEVYEMIKRRAQEKEDQEKLRKNYVALEYPNSHYGSSNYAFN